MVSPVMKLGPFTGQVYGQIADPIRPPHPNDGFPPTGPGTARIPRHDDFPQGHPYQNVHAVPGPGQAEQNRVPRPTAGPGVWILGSSPYSAQLAGQLGRPYAFALQFGSADVVTAMEFYRTNFRPSAVLDAPYSLLSVGAIANDDAAEARRQSASPARRRRGDAGRGRAFAPVQSRTAELIADHYNLPDPGDGAPVPRQAVPGRGN